MTERITLEPNRKQGIIIKGIGGFYYVKTADHLLECRARGIFRLHGITPLAGDRVTAEGNEGQYVIAEIAPRRNSFERPPIANVENFFLVVSTADPRPNTLVIDKLTVIARVAGLMPVIILTKTDLERAGSFFKIYAAAGFETIELRRHTRRELKRLRKLCQGRLSVFTGNSGVGKSTLLNQLCGLELETAEISKKLGRGRHTTRAVELFPFAGGFVADTPGFSDIDLKGLQIPPEKLAEFFPEFEPYINRCRYTGCTHTVEQGCAVLAALAGGKIAPERHESYRILRGQLEKT